MLGEYSFKNQIRQEKISRRIWHGATKRTFYVAKTLGQNFWGFSSIGQCEKQRCFYCLTADMQCYALPSEPRIDHRWSANHCMAQAKSSTPFCHYRDVLSEMCSTTSLFVIFQRIADTPADEINGGSEDSTLSKATEGRTSNCEQNGHREILLSLCLIGCDSMIEYQ